MCKYLVILPSWLLPKLVDAYTSILRLAMWLQMNLISEQGLLSLAACTNLTSIDISSGVTFSSKWSNKVKVKGRHDLMLQLYSQLPYLKTTVFDGVEIQNPNAEVHVEPNWSGTIYDERRRYSKTFLLATRRAIMEANETFVFGEGLNCFYNSSVVK